MKFLRKYARPKRDNTVDCGGQHGLTSDHCRCERRLMRNGQAPPSQHTDLRRKASRHPAIAECATMLRPRTSYALATTTIKKPTYDLPFFGFEGGGRRRAGAIFALLLPLFRLLLDWIRRWKRWAELQPRRLLVRSCSWMNGCFAFSASSAALSARSANIRTTASKSGSVPRLLHWGPPGRPRFL